MLVTKLFTFPQILLCYITCFSFIPRSVDSKHLHVDMCAFYFDYYTIKNVLGIIWWKGWEWHLELDSELQIPSLITFCQCEPIFAA